MASRRPDNSLGLLHCCPLLLVFLEIFQEEEAKRQKEGWKEAGELRGGDVDFPVSLIFSRMTRTSWWIMTRRWTSRRSWRSSRTPGRSILESFSTRYTLHVKIGNLIVKYMGVLLISFLPPRFKGNSKPYYYYILL